MSVKTPVTPGIPDVTVAVYKGLKVEVYTVKKTELAPTRQDLVDLINVCSVSSSLVVFSFLEFGLFWFLSDGATVPHIFPVSFSYCVSCVHVLRMKIVYDFIIFYLSI